MLIGRKKDTTFFDNISMKKQEVKKCDKCYPSLVAVESILYNISFIISVVVQVNGRGI